VNAVLWVLQGLLAAAFLASGAMKLFGSRERAAEQMAWVKLYPAWGVKAIGAAEVAGALGLVLPAVTDVAPVLVPIAAIGLVLLMIGAALTHLRIGASDYKIIPVNLVLLALAAIVAWGRLGPYPF
jgi:uncharacterized membrane protein YphA (DoxX/SURF4 family)